MALCRTHHMLAHRYFESGRYETLREATWASTRDVRVYRQHRPVLRRLWERLTN